MEDLLKQLEHLDLTGSVKKTERAQAAFGGYSDVFVGILARIVDGNAKGMKVAIKELRVHLRNERQSFIKVRPCAVSFSGHFLTIY